jgi:hypothetical protein
MEIDFNFNRAEKIQNNQNLSDTLWKEFISKFDNKLEDPKHLLMVKDPQLNLVHFSTNPVITFESNDYDLRYIIKYHSGANRKLQIFDDTASGSAKIIIFNFLTEPFVMLYNQTSIFIYPLLRREEGRKSLTNDLSQELVVNILKENESIVKIYNINNEVRKNKINFCIKFCFLIGLKFLTEKTIFLNLSFH